MNRPRVAWLTVGGIAALSLTACVATTRITSNKAQGYTDEPKRIFVVSDVGTEWGNEFADAFRTKLVAIAAECGAAVEVSRVSRLELDSSVHTSRMKSFAPDTLMIIKRNGGTRHEHGGIYHVIYDVRLIDVQRDKTVWRANTDFYRGGGMIPVEQRGEALAVDLTERLKADQVLRSCSAGGKGKV